MWITRLALRYPITTVMCTLAILVLGLLSLSQLAIDMVPDIQIPSVSVVTYYRGAGPADMEQSITTQIERTVSSTPDIDYVYSSTREGVAMVRILFNWGVNTDVSMVDVIQKINRVMNSLPIGTTQPMVSKFDITSQPVCQVVLSGDIDQRDLYDLAVNTIQPQLERINGVASANVRGGRMREIQIRVDRNRIEAMNIPITQVTQAIANANLIVPSGSLKSGVFDYSLKTESQFDVVEPMGNIIVATVNGVPIRVKDIGTVEDSYEEQTQIVRNDGNPGMVFAVQKTPGANTVKVVDDVIEAIGSLRDVPPTVKATLAANQSLYIRNSINGLVQEGFFGAMLAMIVVLVFLRNGRSAGIIFLAIPISFLVTFIFFRFSDISLNIMTLGGLALGIGRLLDDSIVELEVISRHYSEYEKKGITKLQATLDAASEVASPIFIATLTTVIVFLPVIFLQGISKMLFIPLVVTIAIALFASFGVSRTVTPLLCWKFLKPEKEHDPNSKKLTDRLQIKSVNFFNKIDNTYYNILKYALSHKKTIIFTVIGIFLVSLLLFNFIGTEFFPEQDESQFSVSVRMPIGTRVEETENFIKQVEKIIQENVPEVRTIIANMGVPSGSRSSGAFGGGNSGSHSGSVSVILSTPEERDRTVFEIIRDIRPKLTSLPGATVIVNTSGFLKFLFNFGSGAPIDVAIYGHDFEDANTISQQIFEIVKATPGATDVLVSRELNLPEIRLKINREKAGSMGVSVAEISNTVTTAINGTVASSYTDPITGNIYSILVRMSEDYRNKIDDLKKLTVKSSTGNLILIGNLVEIELAKAPIQIDRRYQQRIVSVTANTQGRDLGSIAQDIQAEIAKLQIPVGFDVRITGNFEKQQEAFGGLIIAFLLAIILVYMVMASQFQSLVDPFIIMFTIPLGIIGVLWAFFLTNTTLSVTSAQGIIVMVGIVVSNGILLIDYTNKLRKTGLGLREAVELAGRVRLRPILMTTISTVFGLLPLAVGIGGESAQGPLAIAVIGGLSVSTVLTLLLVPTLYTLFEERFKRKEVVEV